MAQNITLQGASYSAVPSILLPKTGGGHASFVDVTDTTAVAADVASGKYFYTSSGVLTQGTSSGGGGGGVTKVASGSFSASTTSTTAATVETWATAHSEIWTSEKIVYIKVRDAAGKRNNYFYGSDTFFINIIPINGTSTTSVTSAIRYVLRYSSDAFGSYQSTGTTGYGVYADTIYSDGRIRIRSRYSSSYSLTVNGTYKVDAYLIDVGGILV